MLDANPQAVLDLRRRTRERNRGVWVPMFAGTALALDEANLKRPLPGHHRGPDCHCR